MFRGDKSVAQTCGYAIDGLGFFYIPHVQPKRQKEDFKVVIVKMSG